MTTLGKILVFVNLIFSVLVGGLVVVVFMARTNFADALTKERANRQLDQGIARAKLDELVRVESEYKKELASIQGALTKTQKDLATQLNVNQSLAARLQGDTLDRDQVEKIKAAAQIEIQRGIADVQAITKRLEAASAQNTQLVKDINKVTQEKLTAEIEAKTLLDINQRLEAQFQVLAKEMARFKATGSAPTSTVSLGGKNPPTEKIDGQVVQATESLLKLSVGSDSGLRVGHTMELFRLGGKSTYLGTVRITSIEAKAAVAQPVGRLNAVPQNGDMVSSRLN